MQETKFTSHKRYLFGLLLSTKVKEDSQRPKNTSSFLICPNLNDSQAFKSNSYKKYFLQRARYRRNLLRCMFFVPCDNWKTLFFLRVFSYCEIFSTAILSLSLKQVFERSPYFTQSVLHNNSAVLILMLMLRSKIKLSYTLLKHTRDNHTRNTMRQMRFCSSFKSENGRKSLVQIMQNQCEFFFFFFVVACRLVY